MCLPRTGSTNITNYYRSVNEEYKVYNEPFNPPIQRNLMWPVEKWDKVIQHPNVFVKGIGWHIPKELKHLTLSEFYKKIYKEFDKVVILKRKDIGAISKSIVHSQTSGEWHRKYVSGDVDKRHLREVMEFITERDRELNEIIKENNSIVYHYEDIFEDMDTLKEFLNVIGSKWNEREWNRYLSPTNRYRIEGE